MATLENILTQAVVVTALREVFDRLTYCAGTLLAEDVDADGHMLDDMATNVKRLFTRLENEVKQELGVTS